MAAYSLAATRDGNGRAGRAKIGESLGPPEPPGIRSLQMLKQRCWLAAPAQLSVTATCPRTDLAAIVTYAFPAVCDGAGISVPFSSPCRTLAAAASTNSFCDSRHRPFICRSLTLHVAFDLYSFLFFMPRESISSRRKFNFHDQAQCLVTAAIA